MTSSAVKLKDLGISSFEYNEIVKRLGRVPNELELYFFSAMWSEHCGYKHSKKYLNLLPDKGALYSGENSGGIRLGRHIIFFKTESHNHPSAVEPYQGAATGIGGILRDILAMNARPIALLNSLKFGPIVKKNTSDMKNADAASIRRNKYLLNGVAEGISDYGNSTGVPTIGGEVSFNECFNLSPLVNVMAVGISRKDKVKTARAKANSYIVLIGSRTGRDGLFGAAFASKELEGNKEDKLSVQIGDPYVKKNVIEATLEILKSKNVFSCQDLGAAGLLSSTTEMADKGGVSVELYLEKVPLREKNMMPYEIMLSESQERMVFTANRRGVGEIFEICKKYEINADIIGKTKTGHDYNLFLNGEKLCGLDVRVLTNPVLYDLNSKKPEYIDILQQKRLLAPESFNNPENLKHSIFKMVSEPEFASKKFIYERYDNTVGARTLKNSHSLGVSPLYIFEEGKTIGFSMDSNEKACFLDPYTGAFNAVFESFRNAVSSGFEPLGITNCLNFANPEKPDVAWQFIQTINGMKDALEKLKIPVVSGNVSFYNEGVEPNAQDCSPKNLAMTAKNKIHPVPVIGMMSKMVLEKPLYAVVEPNSTIFLIGKNIDKNSNTGGSLYQKVLFGFECGKPDNTDVLLEMKLKNTIFSLAKKEQIQGCIDVSKGGFLGALLIMLFNSRKIFPVAKNAAVIGFKGNLQANISILFGEITGRYLISTTDEKSVQNYLKKHNVPFNILGKTDTSGILDFGFAKIRTAELDVIYQNSLEKKA